MRITIGTLNWEIIMMNKITLSLLLTLSFSTMMAQKVESTAYGLMLKGLLSHSVETLSVQEVPAIPSAIFLDAREKKEFEVSHLKGAKHLGYDNADWSVVDGINQKDTIIVYCSVGYRSEKMAEALKRKGFTNVYNLYGGIFEWKNQGYPVYQKQSTTEKVHAYNRVWGIWLNKGEKVYD